MKHTTGDGIPDAIASDLAEVFEICQRIVPRVERLLLVLDQPHPTRKDAKEATVLTHRFDGDRSEIANALHSVARHFEE